MWRACVKNQPCRRNPFTSTLIPARVYLCDSALIHVLMHCKISQILHAYFSQMIGAGGCSCREWWECKASAGYQQKITDDGKEPHTNEQRSSEHQGSQPPLCPLGSKDCTAHALGINFQAHEVPGDYQDGSAQLHCRHITSGQLGYHLSGDKVLSILSLNGYCLSCL